MIRCIACGYSLHGLPENRCPECGRSFEPAAPNTFTAKLWKGGRYLAIALCGIVAMLLPFPVLYLLGVLERALPTIGFAAAAVGAWALIPCVFGGVVAECHVVEVCWRALSRERQWVRQPRMMVVALAISVTVAVVWAGLVILLLLTLLLELLS